MDKVASLLQQYDTLSSFPWACVLAVEKLVQWLKEKETGLIAPPLQINISSIRSVSLPRKVGIVCTQHVLSCTFTCMTAERIWGSGMEKPSQTLQAWAHELQGKTNTREGPSRKYWLQFLVGGSPDREDGLILPLRVTMSLLVLMHKG